MDPLKILYLDIEISPTLVTVWGLWNQNININQIHGNSEVLSWAAAWKGDQYVHYASLRTHTKEEMLREIFEMINEADAVVTYNGDRFDLKILNQEFALMGLATPAPYKSVDLIKTMKKQFRGTSNKLAYWLDRFNLPAKKEHRGYQLWLDCMDGKASAFKELEEYNIGDITSLEALYERILPWISNHPNVSLHTGKACCTKCGSSKYQKRGFQYTKSCIYQRFQCTDCGSWFQEPTNVGSKDKMIQVG